MSQFGTHNAEELARELGACLRDSARHDASSEHMRAEGERLRRAVGQIGCDSSEQPRLGWGRALVLAAAATVMLVLGVGAWAWRNQQTLPLAFDVIGPGRVSAKYVASPPGASTLLKFTDGSTVSVLGGTRLRVPELHSDGATLMLDSGKATVSVLHRHANTHWTVVAGPFAIAIVGTKFDVEWVPEIERLTVDMIEGQVEVGGPKFASPATVRGGQHLEASSSDARWTVEPLPLLEPNVTAKGADVPPVEAGPRGSNPSSHARPASAAVAHADSSPTRRAASSSSVNTPAVPSTRTQSPPALTPTSVASAAGVGAPTTSASEPQALSWSKLVARGESQKVVAEADAMGQKSCFGRCSSSDLRALADAARYSGRLDLAEASLRALRERFPAQSGVAAYLLGAVDEARGRNASALRWYEEYVAATASGGFLPEALAGRLRMLVATNGYTSARKAALEYLERYPNGIGARTARQILQRH